MVVQRLMSMFNGRYSSRVASSAAVHANGGMTAAQCGPPQVSAVPESVRQRLRGRDSEDKLPLRLCRGSGGEKAASAWEVQYARSVVRRHARRQIR